MGHALRVGRVSQAVAWLREPALWRCVHHSPHGGSRPQASGLFEVARPRGVVLIRFSPVGLSLPASGLVEVARPRGVVLSYSTLFVDRVSQFLDWLREPAHVAWPCAQAGLRFSRQASPQYSWGMLKHVVAECNRAHIVPKMA